MSTNLSGDVVLSKRQREANEVEETESSYINKKTKDREAYSPGLTRDDFTVGLLCALPKEQIAATAMLDQEYPDLPTPSNDPNAYTFGSMGKHNIVIACLPKGKVGTNAAATFATQMVRTFRNIKVGLMVGIGGGIPPTVRLGDVVVSTPTDQYPGVVQWGLGKAEKDGQFKRTGALNNPPNALLTALAKMETKHAMNGPKIPQYWDDLKRNWPRLVPKYTRSESLIDPLFAPDASDSSSAEPRVHYGLIASGNQVIKDAEFRDKLNESLGGNVLCVEMEAAGLMGFPCIVIRGICDYADAQKNDDWQEYAAAVSAAFAKELLQYVQPSAVDEERPVREILRRVLDTLPSIEENTLHTRAKLDRKEDIDILDWLTPIDYGPQQSDHFKRRQAGTGQWLLESTQFQTLLDATEQTENTLFCPGIPGAGKTILTSIVVDDLQARFRNDAKVGVVYIYCNYQRQNEQNLGHLLASVVKQLAESHPSLLGSVRGLYDEHRVKRTRPPLNEVLSVLQAVAAVYSRVFIIVDALDECQTSDGCRTKFLSELFNLQEKHKINIFATSRSIPEIISRFMTSMKLDIFASTNDVAIYLMGHMDQLPSCIQEDPQLQQEVKAGISKAADGMFLLARIYLSLLYDKLTPNDIRSTLRVFQDQDRSRDEDKKVRVLSYAYDQAMTRINGQMAGFKELAMEVLVWITYAKRQLTTLELQHALATKPGRAELDLGGISRIQDIISSCAGLVTVDEESSIVRLVHYTTQEYLERTLIDWYPDAQSKITIACVSYLSFTVFETGFCMTDHEFEERLRSNPFYHYAAQNWGHHALTDMTRNQAIVDFLESESKVEASSQALLAWRRDSTHYNYSQIVPRSTTRLHLAAYFGCDKAVNALLMRKHSPDPKDSYGATPLKYAARRGQGAVVKKLLAVEADTDVADSNGRTALYEAASGGHLEVIERLLAAGADANTTTESRLTALFKAVVKVI